jgi:restriction endonuclease S subunit
MTFGAITISTFDDIRIPLPPLDVQQNIVQECEAVDALCSVAKNDLVFFEKTIAGFFESNHEGVLKRISDICEMSAGKFIPAKEIEDVFVEGLYPCFGGNGLRGYTKVFNHEGVHVLIGRQGALCGNVHLTNNQKFYATEHAIIVRSNGDINKKWLYYKLISMNLNQYSTGVAQPGLSIQTIKSLQLYIPPLAEQEALVAQIETLEAQIAQAQAVIDAAPAQKQAILKKYL